MNSIRVVTFDVGRTLLHWWTYTPRQFTALCRLAGLPINSERENEIEAACARFWKECPPSARSAVRPDWWRRHNLAGLRAAGLQGDPERMLDLVDEAAASVGDTWVLDPDVPAVLDVLHSRGIRLAAVSNADGEQADRLARYGIARYFEFIADSGVMGIRKPDPRIYREVCRRLNVAPPDCIHVGDRIDAGVGMAQSVGACPVLYDPLDCHTVNCNRVKRLMGVVDLIHTVTHIASGGRCRG